MAEALPGLDYAAFASDLDDLRVEVEAEVASGAHAHLRAQSRWATAFTLLGYATSWIVPNPVSAALMSLGMTARWTIVAHHTSHRALDRLPGVPAAETSRGFAKGARRWFDWFDWLDPEAWDYEHNKLHHFHTGEVSDPDLVEEQVERIRTSPKPHWVKLAVIGFYAFAWKFLYYAPNTHALLQRERKRRVQKRTAGTATAGTATAGTADAGTANAGTADVHTNVDLLRAWSPFNADGRHFWRQVAGPYILLRFILLPALFLPIGLWAAGSVLLNTVFAELLTGLHTFVVVVPNHAGDDMHRFARPPTDRAEFYVRQVLGSVNFRTGGAVNDFLHGFLNYQIEHHLWPDLPPLAYQRVAPKVRALCARHGVPYVQEGVFARVRKLIDIMTGRTSMIVSETRGKHEREALATAAK